MPPKNWATFSTKGEWREEHPGRLLLERRRGSGARLEAYFATPYMPAPDPMARPLTARERWLRGILNAWDD